MSDFALVYYIFSVCFTRKQKKKESIQCSSFSKFQHIFESFIAISAVQWPCCSSKFTLPDMALHTVNGQRCLLKTNSTQLKHCNQQFIRQINENNSITHVSCQYLTSLHIRGYTSDMDRPKCWCGLRSSKENRNHNNIFSWCTSLSLNIFKKIRSQ